MKNAFKREGKTLEAVFLLVAKYAEARYGMLNAYYCDILELGLLMSGRMHYTVCDGSYFAAAYESKALEEQGKTTPPGHRLSPYTFIGYGMDELDIILTSDGSCFLAVKKAETVGEHTYYTDEGKDEMALLCYDMGDFGGALEVALPKMGVPGEDIPKIKAHILSKFSDISIG